MQRAKRMERPWIVQAQPREETRPLYRSDDLYHSWRWTQLSRRLRRSPEFAFCAECRKQGRYVPATVVDHIIPFPVCKDFFDVSNLQPLCDNCNNLKGIRDREHIIKHFKTNKQQNK